MPNPCLRAGSEPVETGAALAPPTRRRPFGLLPPLGLLLSLACGSEARTPAQTEPDPNGGVSGKHTASGHTPGGSASVNTGGEPHSSGASTVNASGNGNGSAGSEAECVRTVELPTRDLQQDAELWGRDTRSELPVYAFSQSTPSTIDPQLFEIGPTVSLRTTNQWGTSGTKAEDYSADSIRQLQQLGTRVILGLTATVVFESQFGSNDEFRDVVSRDISNEPVPHDEIVPGAYRGNLANPQFRDLVVRNAMTLIDVGADGVFFDEANAGYSGKKFDGNEGFDDYHEADFRRYLCDKFPTFTPADFAAKFGFKTDNWLDCSAPQCLGRGFSLRRHMADKGYVQNPGRADRAIFDEWGRSTTNRLYAAPKSFLETYDAVYWADIVRRVRRYARETYQREILITSNGLFPFVDLQSVGLYPYNSDAPAGSANSAVNYVPTNENGTLNARASLLDTFVRLRTHAQSLAPNAPVVLFIDWPNTMMDAYYAFSQREKRDYFRIYAAEAYASGIRFAWHLKTSMPNDPTARDSGMLDWFIGEADFYRTHSALYLGAQPSNIVASTALQDITTSVTVTSDGGLAVHLINHDAANELVARDSVTVSLNAAVNQSTASVVSPDPPSTSTIPVSTSNDQSTFVLPTMTSYAVVVLH